MTDAQRRIGTMFGRYRIDGFLGEGGMGQVYQACDTEKNRTVALKILRDEVSQDVTFRTRFQREARAAATVQEPHVVPIHDWGEVDGQLFIDMRLVAGHDLSDLLRAGPMDPARSVAIVGQVADALDAAHDRGLVHRDVKPQNILVTPADFAYLVDFGIAETTGETALTTVGFQVGSPAYMAPERLAGGPSSRAVDVYALAAVLRQALTGVAPPSAASLAAGFASAYGPESSSQERAVEQRVGPALDAVIRRGMAIRPEDRYATAGALARAARHAIEADASPSDSGTGSSAVTQLAGATEPASKLPTGPVASGVRRRWWPVVAVVVVAAVALASAAVALGVFGTQRDVASGVQTSPAHPQAQATRRSAPAPGPSAVPPLVRGRDAVRHETCDTGYSLPTATGFGSRSGRGSPETSCVLARNVLTAYWHQYGSPTTEPRTVTTQGALDCRTVRGARCHGADFVMRCAAEPSEQWITCTGGDHSRVYLF